MNPATHPTIPTLEEAAAFTPRQIVDQARQLVQLVQQLAALQHQLDWFRRQAFGRKSEKCAFDAPFQMNLGDALIVPQDAAPPVLPATPIAAHTRQHRLKDADAEALRFFDETRVPVETIELPNPEIAGLAPEEFEVVGTKETYRLAQRPAAYVVIKYVRPVVKRKDTGTLSCPPAPTGVIEGSRADVSFIGGLMVDKFSYHMPLYRVHRRLQDAGLTVSRPWLTQLVEKAANLLWPIYEAQLASIRASRVKAMDETPIKAGQAAGGGKMKQAYFWPIYGERDEVCFPFFPSRRAEHVIEALGLLASEDSVLLTDGYAAYARYAEQTGVTHAQCWTHGRRGFFEAQDAEPQGAAEAIEQIAALYVVEDAIRKQELSGEKKREYRLLHAKPIVETFFAWVDRQFERQGLLPKNPFTAALAYVRERKAKLMVFLSDPDVPIDTNHLERALRPIPMGRKSWLFCWTELGAKHVGIVQSLIATCRLHGIDPYDYLVDVLQRVGSHPASDVQALTPRLWKERFAANPLRSDLYAL